MKIAFFGTPRFAQVVLEQLIKSPYKPEVVVTAADAKIGRGQQIKSSPVKQTAVDNNIKIIEKLDQVSAIDFDLAILVAYGKILPQQILKIPSRGFLNVHPSLLPKYRGPTPVQTAILEGEEKTGISIILLDKEVDHGPVLAQKEVAIEDTDNHLSLNEKLATTGAEVLLEILPDYIQGKLKPVPQDHKKATLTKHIAKLDGEIDLQNPPDKKTLDRMIRAFYPWPGVWARLPSTERSDGGQAKIDGKIIKFLPSGRIQPEGKKPMTKKEFLNGYPKTRELIENLI